MNRAATTGRSNARPWDRNQLAWTLAIPRAGSMDRDYAVDFVLNIVAILYDGAVLKTVCAAPVNCFNDQLTSSDVHGLHALGISISAYATLNIVENTLFVLICVALGALLFWRRSDEPMALFCSFMLVLFGAALTSILSEGRAPLSLGWYVLIEFLYFLGQVSLLLFFFHLFPTGRFVPRWTRWSALLYAGYTVWTIISFTPVSSPQGARCPPVLWSDFDNRGGPGLSLPARLHPEPAPTDEVGSICLFLHNRRLHHYTYCYPLSLSPGEFDINFRQTH